jgi:hypothetical protein
MPTRLYSDLADQLAETISEAIRLVREIFAERPAYTTTDSISKRREAFYFDMI